MAAPKSWAGIRRVAPGRQDMSPPDKVHLACVRQPLDIMRAALFGTQAALPQTVPLRPGCLRHGKSKTTPIAFFSRLSRPPRPRQPYASDVPHPPPHGLLTYPSPQVFPRCLRFALPVITWSRYLAVIGTPPCVTLNSRLFLFTSSVRRGLGLGTKVRSGRLTNS